MLQGGDMDNSELLEMEIPKTFVEPQVHRRRGQGFEIIHDEPYFGKIPQELLRAQTIRPAPKALFGLCHTYGRNKMLNQNPTRYVTQETLARDMGVTTRTIRTWIKELEEKGWVTVIRRGLNKPNIIILHGERKRRGL
jgi:hypothetical protein